MKFKDIKYTKKNNHKYSFLKIAKLLLTLFIVVFFAYIVFENKELLLNRALLEERILGLGIYAPLGMVGLYILQVFTFFIFPGVLVSAISGYLFGIFYGGLLGSLGASIGGLGLFLLARYTLHDFAQNFALKYKDNKYIKYIFHTEDYKALIFLRMLFFTPQSILSFLCGTTKMRADKFFFYSFIFSYPEQVMGAGYSYVLAWLLEYL